jgi:hypothetical protein
MVSDKIGRFVWHDLFTRNAAQSKSFYERIAGWSYVTEHAIEFAWGGGQGGDYILAHSEGEAGAGFVESNGLEQFGWMPYVEVDDVDATAERALELGGTVTKVPFDVNGVGRNCLLRDPNGACVGITQSNHQYPAPTKQFGAEFYLALKDGFPTEFYSNLFGWRATPSDHTCKRPQPILSAGIEIGLVFSGALQGGTIPSWVPSIRVPNQTEALRQVPKLNGSVVNPKDEQLEDRRQSVVVDSNGTLSVLMPR